MITLFLASLGWPIALVALAWALELRRKLLRHAAYATREVAQRELDPGELDARGVLEVLRGRRGYLPASKTLDRLQDALEPLLQHELDLRMLEAAFHRRHGGPS